MKQTNRLQFRVITNFCNNIYTICLDVFGVTAAVAAL